MHTKETVNDVFILRKLETLLEKLHHCQSSLYIMSGSQKLYTRAKKEKNHNSKIRVLKQSFCK
jgi:hypothetical protein